MSIAYLALGSNLGDRSVYIQRALCELKEQEGLSATHVEEMLDETKWIGFKAVAKHVFQKIIHPIL